MTGDELIGVTTDKAARVVDVSARRLAAWERTGLVAPTLSDRVRNRKVRLYRLDDLVEGAVVKLLEDRGVTLARIKRVVEAQRSPTAPRPLRHLVWATDANRIYVQFPDGSWYGDRRPHQSVIRVTIDLNEIRLNARERALSRAGEPGRIERRPRTMGNKPVFAGTRTPVAAVHAYMRRDIPDPDILRALPHLEQADLDAAREALSA